MGLILPPKNSGSTNLTFLIPVTVFFLLVLFYLQYKEKTSRYGLAQEHIKQGLKYEKEKNFNFALGEFDKAIQYNPQSALAYSGRGSVYWKTGDLDKAIEDLSMSIHLNPDIPAYMTRAHLYEKKGDIEKAIMDYSKALEKEPGIQFLAKRKQCLCNSTKLPEDKRKKLCQ